MKSYRIASMITAATLCASPLLTMAAEPAAAAPAQEETEKKLQEAQQRLDAAVREVAELSGQLGRRFTMRAGVEPGGPPPRALLGVAIGNGNEKDGAHVLNVSPGGSAAEAGIKAGDVITSIGGQDLTKEGNPGRALVERVRTIEPDRKLQVSVLRDGKKMNFDVTPHAGPQLEFRRFAGPGGPGQGGPGMGGPGMAGPGGPGGAMPFTLRRGPGEGGEIRREIRINGPGDRNLAFDFRGDEMGTRFRGMEFANLSDKLGSYFGVKSGVLVVRAGNSAAFKLQDGDVIVAIDGREPNSAQHAGRILRSYQAGEKLNLKVMRDRKSMNIEVTLPGGDD